MTAAWPEEASYPEVRRIGLVADTHLLPRDGAVRLPAELVSALGDVDLILHAGDLCCREVLTALAGLAPVLAVRGNVDPAAIGLPPHRVVRAGGLRVGLTHGHLGPGGSTPARVLRAFPDADVVVFGHSHRPVVVRRDGGPLLVNPGSPTQPRGLAPTCALLHVGEGAPRAEVVEIAPR
jgi:putative phosphoesterase